MVVCSELLSRILMPKKLRRGLLLGHVELADDLARPKDESKRDPIFSAEH